MFGGGLRPCHMVLNRGCVNNLAFILTTKNGCDTPEVPVDLTNKKLWLTCKTQPWDTDADDSDATFKVLGTIPDSTNEPNRVVFTISEAQSYVDPTVPYFFDIVWTDLDDSNADRRVIGDFTVIAGANNEQAGGGA